MYLGLIIKESLESIDFLQDNRIVVLKEDIWEVGSRAVDWQPKEWTAIYVEGADKDLGDLATAISCSILEKWYANLSNPTIEYVIFRKKIFAYEKGDGETKQKAKMYAKDIGVPEHQLDW
ncbi:MAG: hypothetical protein HQ556_07660 [Candidatus Marinimicrobia bacterium]|nr:hypothetical protein [Candidatus Neomarinimicrobiota bacterium]